MARLDSPIQGDDRNFTEKRRDGDRCTHRKQRLGTIIENKLEGAWKAGMSQQGGATISSKLEATQWKERDPCA